MSTYRTCSHGRPLDWPREIWIGVTDSQWPIRAFGSAEQAAQWVAESPADHHAYQVDNTILAEAKYVPPVPASHTIAPPPPERGHADGDG